jgi:tetratricopeptide (TPR) repeat protein
MNKDHILYGVIGLLIGLIIGYLATNSINRGAILSATAGVPGQAAALGGAGALPPGHPSLDGASGAPPPAMAARLEKARNEPSNFEAQMQAANLSYQIENYPQALEFFDRANKLKPNDFDALSGLGNASYDLERYPEAERWYLLALQLKPDAVNVRTDLGSTYLQRKPPEIDKAIATYRASLNYDPRHERTLQNLTTALIEKGDQAAARETLKQLEQVNPSNKFLPELRAKVSTP